MARGLNKATLIGNLGADPETRQVGETNVTSLRIATSETFKDRSGEQQERTEWHRLNLWDKLSDIAQQYLKKGSRIYVEGKIETRQWDKDGEKRYSTEIRVQQMLMLDAKAEGQPVTSTVDSDLPF
tara:strand:+ start:73 stop:450 length:378 start_codon:yes stop_codon:yes gene_type:complete